MPQSLRLSNGTIYKRLGILKICNIYKLERSKLMHRVKNCTLPSNLNKMFKRIDTVHMYPNYYIIRKKSNISPT